MPWVDIGVNLTNERMNVDAVLLRAKEAGIVSILVTGTSVSESQKALLLTQQYPQFLFSTAGVHPHYAGDVQADYIDQLKHIASQKNVLAIGECGLDFNRNFSPRQQQLDVFEQQLNLAVSLQKPVFLHERDAFAEQIELLQHYRPSLCGGVVHCFTGNVTQMQAYLELDLYIGVTGWVCDMNRGQALRDAVKLLPLERLLLETDSPYLRPKGLANNRKIDGGSNEPAYIPYIAQQLTDLMGVELGSVEEHSFANSQKLFGLLGQG
jgi:TatD DNase family protein